MKVNLDNSYITDNSNECEKGCYFLLTNSNSKYENDAKSKGALVINEAKARELLKINENIKIIGITGTNGKTTTAAAIYSILLDLGKKVFLCGTRGAFCNDEKVAAKSLTTGFLLELLSYLQIATLNNCEYFVMEVSSHAIAQNRCGDMKFTAKIYTNLTQDHLDFHETFENYANCKASFFQDECLKIINQDAYKFSYNVKGAITYGIENPALYSVKAYTLIDGIETVFAVKNELYEISSSLKGLFNIYNLLAAFACVNELVKPNKDDLTNAIANYAGVMGRMQSIPNKYNREIIVDFAHTPDGIANVLEAMKHKELIVVLGAGGNRDKSKRTPMAKIASHYAKTLFLTSDNPRDEEPIEILKDMIDGLSENELKNINIVIDRRLAIYKALLAQNKNECVMILGKGDEDYQEIKGVKYPFLDEKVALECLDEIHNYEEKIRLKGEYV